MLSTANEITLDLSIDEISEIHLSLIHMKGIYQDQVKNHKSKAVQEIALRQLERVTPICYYVESVIREYHTNNQ